ncbi:MAG: hypothetical protein OEV49_05750 [candidate division Zixibacteria bacterium]|nr:hypothetical protein [candidate division Zixibacteria bacterium]MDH3937678.1 hypothetical protein [candidate division Zixibacteria bacterium]MDH4032329.1 hypothetical protein [candidate division Zixibacteria bacterium]
MIKTITTIGVPAVFCLSVLCGSVAASATQAFKIEDYVPQKFTDLEWRLNGRLELRGLSQDRDELPVATDEPRNEKRQTDQKYNRLDLSTWLLYRYETIPRTLTLGSGFGISMYRNKQETLFDRVDSQGLPRSMESESTEHTYSISYSPSLDYNTYLIGDLFMGLTGNGSFGYMKIPKEDYEESSYQERQLGDYKRYYLYHRDSDGTEVQKYAAISLTVGTGLGRLYEGHFAATALYIVDELKSSGLLEHEPSTLEMVELTEIIYQNRMTHEVDHRLAKIDALDAVMAFLTDIGSITESPRMSYVLIQDVWDFFPHNSRRFGTQVKVGAGWDYYYSMLDQSRDDLRFTLTYQHHVDSVDEVDTLTYSTNTTHNDFTSRRELDNVFIFLAANHCKPLSLKWQWDTNVELTYFVHAEGVRHRNPSSALGRRTSRSPLLVEVRGLDDYYQFKCSSVGTYILNSRTNLRFWGDFTYGRYDTPVESGSDRTRTIKSWEGNLGSSLNYRLSIPTKLTISGRYRFHSELNVNDYGSVYDYENDWGLWQFNASISHNLY